MTKSVLSLLGRDKVDRLMREAVSEAQAKKIAAGLVKDTSQAQERARLLAQGMSAIEATNVLLERAHQAFRHASK